MRAFATSLLGALYGIFLAHWILNLQQLLQLLSGGCVLHLWVREDSALNTTHSAIGLRLTAAAVQRATETLEEQAGNSTARFTALIPEATFIGYATVWQYLVPLITETTLLGESSISVGRASRRVDTDPSRAGFSTVILLPVLRTALQSVSRLSRLHDAVNSDRRMYLRQKSRHQWWRSSAWIIPVVTAVMFGISLTHWVASKGLYTSFIQGALRPAEVGSFVGNSFVSISTPLALLTSTCLAINVRELNNL